MAIVARTAIGIGDYPLLRFHGALRALSNAVSVGDRGAINVIPR